MDDPVPQSHPSNLEKVLKSYQTVAMSSLGGPSSARWVALNPKTATTESGIGHRVSSDSISFLKDTDKLTDVVSTVPSTTKVMVNYDYAIHQPPPPPFPIQQMPVFTPLDRNTSEKSTTILEGERISCFEVGGERRLCLPQILNSVLREFSLQQINAMCDELHIYCSRCNPEQLEVLKLTGILPYSAPSCGLITKTDAERLCNALRSKCRMLTKSDSEKPSYPMENSFKVYHECFGKCKGLFTPELYVNADAACIACFECDELFCPQKFVMHSHHDKENRTCHWGFDSGNWRNYLHLSKEIVHEKKWQEMLDKVKAKFDLSHLHKRKQNFDENDNPKRCKMESNTEDLKESYFAPGWPGFPMQRPSAFRPWSPAVLTKEGKMLPEHGTVLVRDGHGISTYLRMGPPVLVNPERVIPHTAASNYDSQFAPNVALAPHKADKKEMAVTSTSIKGEKMSPDCTEMSPPPRHPDVESSLEREIELVKALLESDALDTQDGRDRLLQELARIRVHQEERLQNAVQSKKALQQELEMMRAAERQRLIEAEDTKRHYQHQIDCIRLEYERRLHQSREENERLEQELRRIQQNSGKVYELSQDNAQLSSENGVLRKRLEIERKRNWRESQSKEGSPHSTQGEERRSPSSKEQSPRVPSPQKSPVATGSSSPAK